MDYNIFGIEGEVTEIKTAVKDGETYLYIFIDGNIIKIPAGDHTYGKLYPESSIDSDKTCFELNLKNNSAAILLKVGDSVYMEATGERNYSVPSTLKKINHWAVK